MTNSDDIAKPPDWDPTCERFVAFLDVMGFKERIHRNKHETVVNEMLTLVAFKGLLEKFSQLVQPYLKTDIKSVLFSDSMLLVTLNGSLDSIKALLIVTSTLIWNAALKDIPMKGAIAYGRQTADLERSLHVGIPLIDAYELQNDLLMYGVVLHHSAEQRLIQQEWMAGLERTHLWRYRTPVRSGLVNHYALDCWHSEAGDASRREREGILSGFYCAVSGSTRRYVDNTAEFCNWLKGERECRGSGKSGSS